MKKFVPILLFLSVLFTLFPGVGQASGTNVVPKLYLNDKLLQTSVAPQIIQNKYTIVPIRIITENIGYDVTWLKQTQTVIIHNDTDEISLKINDNIALVNNEKVPMDTPAILQDDTTLIPLRFVAENLGIRVKWVNETKSAYLYKEDKPVETEKPSVPAEPTGKLTSIAYDGINNVIVNFEGKIAPKQPFKLDNPKRIVIDIPNVGYSDTLASQFTGAEVKMPITGHSALQQVRYSIYSSSPAAARLVLDLTADADVALAQGGNELIIQLTAPAKPAEPTPSPSPETTPSPSATPPPDEEKIYTVVIDAGHGGTDPGAKSVLSGKWEKEFNLAVSLKVKALLDKEKRIKPMLSRPDDNFVTLANRVTFAKDNKADLFVSIHANSNTNKDVTGTETYYTRDDSKAFADVIHKHFVKATGLKDRKVKQQSFRVIRETTMPAVLLEAGFLSNESDSKVLFNESAQNKMAAAIVAGIKEYLKLS
ncbi:N-acetylmuramoyl-L-alanine amidase family protein [Paenibacillus sp. NEAU-GSW1]|uniref:N-acetylmuramoyl-L-alanine amidase family protein n=1 Tax=Paenibacillus sp. NEAU-GSW1 TaxID=2682486 RepID=UPI0012E1C069|nr:N-acetylmuramoyl-L-alanine amidase family protein [Paenibacillus sp. NEAU-GSW1]MUT65420.1 AMIN domain-containing protein [Paenibacillus sp. NEAU-GSW1]